MGALRDHFLNLYPYTDFHELNADWLIKMLMRMVDEVENFVAQNAIKYADPIQWNITRQYEKNTIVVDPITGTAYISNYPVPMGIALSNTHYWSVVFDLGRFITLASQNFANTYESVTTTTATQPTDEGNWVVWDSILYQAKNDIHVGDAYVVDGNIEKKTVEDFFNDLKSLLAAEAQTRADEDARIELELSDLIASEIATEAQTRADEDARIELELSDLITSQIGVVNGEISDIENSIGDLDNLTTSDKTNIVSAINEINGGVKYCNNRSEVAGVNALLGGYILSANAYQDDGVTSLYKVTSDVADGYLNIAMDNGNTASLVYDDVIHAHQVGAYPGGTDCTNAITYIINNVAGLTVKFGTGRYTFSDKLWLNDNQSLIGEGANVTTLYINQDPPEQHGEFIGIIGEHGTVKKNITLRDFSIDIYYLASATEDVNAIGCVSADGVLIERVNVLRSNWRGFQFEGEASGSLSNVIVRDCIIKDCYKNGIGLSHNSGGKLENITFDNIVIINSNEKGGMAIEGYSAGDSNMSNITVNGLHYKGGTVRAIYLLYASDVILNNVTVDDVNSTLYGVIQVQDAKRIKLNNTSVKCDLNNANNFCVLLYGGSDIVVNELSTVNATVGVQIQNGADNVIVSNCMLNSRTGGVPIRNQVTTLKGYISGCVYNNAVSNASTDFIELS